MGAARLKAKTTITEYEEQELSLRALEVLPEMLQVRANLDKGWSLQYSKDYAAGAAFPPILVYRLPDGRLVVTDGFHRVDACLAIGKKTIRAQIREGTMHEALMAAIEANTAAFHRGRPFGEDDRRHAAELLFGDPECWHWDDRRLGNKCGLNPSTIKRYRVAFSESRGIPLPDYVIIGSGHKRRKYRNAGTMPAISTGKDKYGRISSYYASIDGKVRYLSTKPDKAVKILEEIMRDREKKKVSLGFENFRCWLVLRGINAVSRTPNQKSYPSVRGLSVGSVIIVCTSMTGDRDVLWAIACLQVLRELDGNPNPRMVAVCYHEGGPRSLIDIGRRFGIEFLTPDELVESLKGAEGPCPGDRGPVPS